MSAKLYYRIAIKRSCWIVASYAATESDMLSEVERIKGMGYKPEKIRVTVSVDGGNYEPWKGEAK